MTFRTNFPDNFFIRYSSCRIWSVHSSEMPMIPPISRLIELQPSQTILCTYSMIFEVFGCSVIHSQCLFDHIQTLKPIDVKLGMGKNIILTQSSFWLLLIIPKQRILSLHDNKFFSLVKTRIQMTSIQEID